MNMLILLLMVLGVSYGHNPAMYQTEDIYHEEFETNPGDDPLRVGPLQCTSYMILNLTTCYGGQIVMARDWALTEDVTRVNIGEYREGHFWSDVMTDETEAHFEGNPLQCGEMSIFWVSLSEGIVSIGHGLEAGYLPFIRATGSTDFHHFSFSSQNETEWAIDIHSTCAS